MYIGDNTKHIKQIIKAIRKERKLKNGLEKAEVNKIWQDLMGDTIDKYTSNLNYNNGKLTVYLTSSTLREELNRGKDKIIHRLNEHYGEIIIKKIIFK